MTARLLRTKKVTLLLPATLLQDVLLQDARHARDGNKRRTLWVTFCLEAGKVDENQF